MEPKFDITFRVDPYEADLLIFLYSYLEQVQLDDILNLESINLILDNFWDEAERIETALLSRAGEKSVSHSTRALINASKKAHDDMMNNL